MAMRYSAGVVVERVGDGLVARIPGLGTVRVLGEAAEDLLSPSR